MDLDNITSVLLALTRTIGTRLGFTIINAPQTGNSVTIHGNIETQQFGELTLYLF